MGDEALVEPVVDGAHGIGENLGVPVDIALVELPVVDEFGVGRPLRIAVVCSWRTGDILCHTLLNRQVEHFATGSHH